MFFFCADGTGMLGRILFAWQKGWAHIYVFFLQSNESFRVISSSYFTDGNVSVTGVNWTLMPKNGGMQAKML